ncbi:hypothetical protein BJ741DRAFT_591604 [Chytriomyces cf. hyalinus JEL632]|nr:hypothetical protein BJ741DRAFT_591604 [Chytriomyces cf. hyalinus JEL632]
MTQTSGPMLHDMDDADTYRSENDPGSERDRETDLEGGAESESLSTAELTPSSSIASLLGGMRHGADHSLDLGPEFGAGGVIRTKAGLYPQGLTVGGDGADTEIESDAEQAQEGRGVSGGGGGGLAPADFAFLSAHHIQPHTHALTHGSSARMQPLMHAGNAQTKRVRFRYPEVSIVITPSINTWIESADVVQLSDSDENDTEKEVSIADGDENDNDTDLDTGAPSPIPLNSFKSKLSLSHVPLPLSASPKNPPLSDPSESDDAFALSTTPPSHVQGQNQKRSLRRRPVATNGHIVDELDILRKQKNHRLKPAALQNINSSSSMDTLITPGSNLNPSPSPNSPDINSSAENLRSSFDSNIYQLSAMSDPAMSSRATFAVPAKTTAKTTGILKIRTSKSITTSPAPSAGAAPVPVSGASSPGGSVFKNLRSPRASNSALKLLGSFVSPPSSPTTANSPGGGSASSDGKKSSRKITRPSSTGTLTGKPKIAKTTFQQSSMYVNLME